MTLTVIGLPLLVIMDSMFGATIVVVALVTNAAEIGSDLVAVLALWRLSPGALVYYGDNSQLAYESAVPVW